MTDAKFEQAAVDACQSDFDKYRKLVADCHGFDYGNAWRAGRAWTLENDPVVREYLDAGRELMLDTDDYEKRERFRKALAAFDALKGQG